MNVVKSRKEECRKISKPTRVKVIKRKYDSMCIKTVQISDKTFFKMSSAPKVRVNNYTINQNISTDLLSKLFVIFNFSIGLNRINIFGIKNVIFKKLTFLYSVSIFGLVIYFTFYVYNGQQTILFKLIQYLIYIIFGFVTRKKLELFYKELNKFDKEVGSTPKITRGSLKILLQTAFIMAFTMFTIDKENTIQFAILYMIHVLENQYYSHLLLLLIQRLRLINWCVKSSLISTETEKLTEVEKFSANSREIKIGRLMDFYCIIVNAHDLLSDVIKRQVKIYHRFLMMLLGPDTFD